MRQGRDVAQFGWDGSAYLRLANEQSSQAWKVGQSDRDWSTQGVVANPEALKAGNATQFGRDWASQFVEVKVKRFKKTQVG